MRGCAGHDAGGGRDDADRLMPSLALSMIVRDAAADLARCLASVRGIVNEIVVADTGSRDETAAIARAHGAQVIAVAWQDDFAAARNAALAPVTADWVLSLDADERLDSAAERELPRLLARRDVDAYEVNIRNYFRTTNVHLYDQLAQPNDGRLEEARDFAAFALHQNLRLFRRAAHIRFTGRVHENVARGILAAGGKIGPPSLLIHHFGLGGSPAELRQKAEIYRGLGRQKLREMPDDAQAHLELGAEELEHFGNPAEALPLFERACRLQSGLGLAWYYLGLTYSRLGRAREAIAALERAEAGGISGSLLFETRGDAHYDLHDFGAARSCYRRALKRNPNSALLESKLGLAEARAGDADAGLARMRRAIRRETGNGALRDRLIAAEAALGRWREAAQAADEYWRAIEAPTERAYLRAASIHAQLGEWRAAEDALNAGLTQWPASPGLRLGLEEVARRGAPAEHAGGAAPVPNLTTPA